MRLTKSDYEEIHAWRLEQRRLYSDRQRVGMSIPNAIVVSNRMREILALALEEQNENLGAEMCVMAFEIFCFSIPVITVDGIIALRKADDVLAGSV